MLCCTHKKRGLLQNLGKVSNSLYLLFERSQATQSGLRKRKAPERRRTELNGVNGDIVCGKVFRPPLSAPQLSRALRREQQRATYPSAKHRRKHLREFARQAQKIYLFIYTHRIKSHRADRKIGSVQVQGSLPCSGGSKGG
jgi:hypothetical protein